MAGSRSKNRSFIVPDKRKQKNQRKISYCNSIQSDQVVMRDKKKS
jgi:hypothetical protein